MKNINKWIFEGPTAFVLTNNIHIYNVFNTTYNIYTQRNIILISVECFVLHHLPLCALNVLLNNEIIDPISARVEITEQGISLSCLVN